MNALSAFATDNTGSIPAPNALQKIVVLFTTATLVRCVFADLLALGKAKVEINLKAFG
jgi:hypothetical protein